MKITYQAVEFGFGFPRVELEQRQPGNDWENRKKNVVGWYVDLANRIILRKQIHRDMNEMNNNLLGNEWFIDLGGFINLFFLFCIL